MITFHTLEVIGELNLHIGTSQILELVKAKMWLIQILTKENKNNLWYNVMAFYLFRKKT